MGTYTNRVDLKVSLQSTTFTVSVAHRTVHNIIISVRICSSTRNIRQSPRDGDGSEGAAKN